MHVLEQIGQSWSEVTSAAVARGVSSNRLATTSSRAEYFVPTRHHFQASEDCIHATPHSRGAHVAQRGRFTAEHLSVGRDDLEIGAV